MSGNMANHAFHTDLPIMVRKPKAVWPGRLDKMGLYEKQIAGDGGCNLYRVTRQRVDPT